MTIQFQHKRNYEPVITDDMLLKIEVHPRGGETIAMESIQTWFLESLKVGDTFEKRVGKAKCSLDDNYSKKAGRELSQSRMKLTKFTVISHNVFGGNLIVRLEDSNKKTYTLCSKVGSKIAHFIEYGF